MTFAPTGRRTSAGCRIGPKTSALRDVRVGTRQCSGRWTGSTSSDFGALTDAERALARRNHKSAYMHAPKMQIPPQGSQPPFQPPGARSPRHPRSFHPGPFQPCPWCPSPYQYPGSALATPAPTPTAPAARPPATARVAMIFVDFIIDQLLPHTYSWQSVAVYSRTCRLLASISTLLRDDCRRTRP